MSANKQPEKCKLQVFLLQAGRPASFCTAPGKVNSCEATRRSEGSGYSCVVEGKKKTEDTFNLKFLHNDEKTINLNLKTCLLPPDLVFSSKELSLFKQKKKKKQTLNKRFWHRRTYAQTVGWLAGRPARPSNQLVLYFFFFSCSPFFVLAFLENNSLSVW